MRYEEMHPISRDDAAKELASNESERISVALVRLALNDPDPKWLQETFLQYRLQKDEHKETRFHSNDALDDIETFISCRRER